MNHHILTSTFFAIFALATAATASAKDKGGEKLAESEVIGLPLS